MIESPSYTLHKLVYSLDREAHRIIKVHLNISYKRALFLIVLHNNEPLTQHELADILGYSDAAVSFMMAELKEAHYVIVSPSADHGRKNIIHLTETGKALAEKASSILDEKFALLGAISGVNLRKYAESTEQLYQALINKESRGK